MNKQRSIWELARLNFPDIACYAIPTLAACQIVLKATEGVFLHNVFAWFTHLSGSAGPFWFVLMGEKTVADTHTKTEQSKTLASFPARHVSVNIPVQMCLEHEAATHLWFFIVKVSGVSVELRL